MLKKLLLSLGIIATIVANTSVASAADSTIDNSNASSTNTSITGSISAVTQISVTVPSAVAFTIEGTSSDSITAPKIPIKNSTNVAVDVAISAFKRVNAGDFTLVENPSTVTNWETLSHKERKLSLGIKKPASSGFTDSKEGAPVWATAAGSSLTVGTIAAKNGSNPTTGNMQLVCKHGMAFTTEETALSLGSYSLTWNISVH